MFHNYWIERISFKEILQNKLIPLLKKKYIGVRAKEAFDFVTQINEEASDFIEKECPDDFIIFPFQINLECDKSMAVINISITIND